MKIIIISALALTLTPMSAFSQSGEAIGPSGNIASAQGLNIRWSMGAIANGLMTSGGVQLSNGYYPQQQLDALSVGRTTPLSKVTLYPNPAVSQVTLSTTVDISATLYDSNGREVRSARLTPEDNTLDVSGLATGTYFVRASTDGQSNTYKLLKQ